MDHATTVEQIVSSFYAGGGNEAHYMLLQFQASREAWSFVWPLLDSSKPWEVQFFAATTLQAKISKHWSEVPESEHCVLKGHLLRVLKSPSTPKLILSKLCEAFASLLINSYSADSKDVMLLDDLIQVLPLESASTLPILVRIFGSLANDTPKQPAPKRAKLLHELGTDDAQGWNKTTWLLQQILSTVDRLVSENSDHTLYLLALDCVLSWLKLGPSLEAINQVFPLILTAATRYVSAHDGLGEVECRSFDVAQDCLILAMTREQLHRRPQLFWDWARAIVAAANEKGCPAFMLLLCNFADTHSRTLLLSLAEESDEKRRWTAQTVVELILQCSEDPRRFPTEESHSNLPYSFWYSLQDDLQTLEGPIEVRARVALKPIYARLTEALLRKSALPPTPAEAGNADERELFRCYRQDAADTLMYCYNVLGKELLLLLGRRLSQPHIDSAAWNDVEASLAALQALSDCVDCCETEFIPEIMNLVLTQVPYERYEREVLSSACSTVGAYAEWIGMNPHPWLEKALQLITHALTLGSVTATPASMALKDISRECKSHLAPLAPAVLSTISVTLRVLPPGQGEGLRLMFAAGKLLNSLPTIEEQLQHLDATLGLCVVRIQDLLQCQSNSSDCLKQSLINHLKMAAMFLSTLEGAIGKSVLDGLLPIFQHIVVSPEWNRDPMIIEAMFNCAQKSLLCLLHPEIDAEPLLPVLLASYKTLPHPAALQFLRQVILLFASDGRELVAPIFAEISAHSLGGFNACTRAGGNLSDYAELLQAYLGLLGQVCRKTPDLMLHVPDQIPEMLRCGILGLGLPENVVIKASGTFIMNALKQYDQLRSHIDSIGIELVSMILDCIVGRVSKNTLESHARVLLALNKNCKAVTHQWIRTALNARDLPVTPGDKEIFARKIMSEHNQNVLTEALQKFSSQCQKPVVGL